MSVIQFPAVFLWLCITPSLMSLISIHFAGTPGVAEAGLAREGGAHSEVSTRTFNCVQVRDRASRRAGATPRV